MRKASRRKTRPSASKKARRTPAQSRARRTAQKPLRKPAVRKRSRIISKSLISNEIPQPVYLTGDGYHDVRVKPVQPDGGLPTQYGEDRIVVLIRDPWWLFAYWEVTPGREKYIHDEIRRRGLHRERSVLRVYDVTEADIDKPHSFFDIELGGMAADWYIDVGRPDREWIVDIGIRTREGEFFVLTRSNRVRTPRFGVSDVLDEEWMLPEETYRQIFALSGGFGRSKSSMDLREVLERYLKGLSSSENSSSFGLSSKERQSGSGLVMSSATVS